MNRPASFLSCTTIHLAVALLASILSGCGAGNDSPAAGNDEAAFTDTLAYCGTQEPSGSAAQPGGWDLGSSSHAGSPTYEVSTIVSPAGSSSATQPTRLQVDIHDYRGITGILLLPGSAGPQWKMGISFSPVMARQSAACVANLAKLTPVTPSQAAPVAYQLAWSSKWSPSAPLASVPGTVIDGFELVSNFNPAGATVFFTLPKAWVASAQGLSVCHLEPSAANWDCAAADVTDAGSAWTVSRPGAQPGVYVVSAPIGG